MDYLLNLNKANKTKKPNNINECDITINLQEQTKRLHKGVLQQIKPLIEPQIPNMTLSIPTDHLAKDNLILFHNDIKNMQIDLDEGLSHLSAAQDALQFVSKKLALTKERAYFEKKGTTVTTTAKSLLQSEFIEHENVQLTNENNICAEIHSQYNPKKENVLQGQSVESTGSAARRSINMPSPIKATKNTETLNELFNDREGFILEPHISGVIPARKTENVLQKQSVKSTGSASRRSINMPVSTNATNVLDSETFNELFNEREDFTPEPHTLYLHIRNKIFRKCMMILIMKMTESLTLILK